MLFAATFMLAALNLFDRILYISGRQVHLLSYVNFDSGQNVATMFSTALLWLCALLVFVIASANQQRRLKYSQWTGLGLLFALLGIDKATLLHTRVQFPEFDMATPFGTIQDTWMVPILVLVILIAGIYLKFFIGLPRDTQKRIVLASMVYVVGVVGLDKAGCAWLAAFGHDMGYHLFVILEEAVEMVGCILFIYAFSGYIDQHLPRLSLRIASGQRET